MTTTGDRIRQRREELGWTQAELARRLGIGQGLVSDAETCRRAIGLRRLLRFAKALGCKPSDLDHRLS